MAFVINGANPVQVISKYSLQLIFISYEILSFWPTLCDFFLKAAGNDRPTRLSTNKTLKL